MKVSYPRTIVFRMDSGESIRFTDAAKAAEFWARRKEEAWIDKNKKDPKYLIPAGTYRSRATVSNQLYDDARVRYRKMKRRSQAIFKRIINES